DRGKALALALESEEKIPLGVLYRMERPTFGERHPQVPGLPLGKRETPEETVRALLRRRQAVPG
ncbi:MAG: hypothetical protein WBX49_10530, partial [Candidatus Deferrimicrobiaceae bacterium]